MIYANSVPRKLAYSSIIFSKWVLREYIWINVFYLWVFSLTPLASTISCYFVSLHLRVIKFEPWLYRFMNDVKRQIRLWPIECVKLLNILSIALFITQIKLLTEANYYIATALNNMNVTALLWLNFCTSILPFDTNRKKRSVVSGTSPWCRE